MKKKILLGILLLLVIIFASAAVIPFNGERAARFSTKTAYKRSHTCCAWGVAKGLAAGGKVCPILPAWAYKHYLPLVGFKAIDKDNALKTGDIVVFPSVPGHMWGHIAIWNGEQWVSDFKQKSIIVARGYRNADYVIFRSK